MATAPTPPHLPHLPAGRRRASAVRRFPPGCGRQHSNAAPPPRCPVSTPYADPPPNPSARAAAKTSSPAAARLDGHNRSWGNGPTDLTKAPAAAEVVVRRLSAVRRYPPGCGRGVTAAAPKPEASVVGREGDAGEIDPLAPLRDVEAQAIDGEKEVMPSTTLDNGEASSSDGAGKSGGDGGGAPEGCGSPGPPCTVTATVLAPLVPWAQHGQRSQQRRKTL